MVTDQKQMEESVEVSDIFSQIDDNVSAEETKPDEIVEEGQLTFTQEELRKRIADEANSIAHKSTATLQENNRQLTEKTKQLEIDLREAKVKRTDEEDDSKLTKFLNRASGEYDKSDMIDVERALRDYVDLGKQNRKRANELDDREAGLDERQDKIDTDNRISHAWALAIQTFSPDSKEIISKMKDFVSGLTEAETDKEMVLLAKDKRNELKASVKNSEKRTHRPDSSRTSVSGGGEDWRKLPPQKQIEYGLQQMKK